MRDTKILKAKCQKTGRWSALELKKVGSVWKVINMIPLTDDESKLLASEIRQPVLESHTTLLACSICGSRKVGSCNCLKKKISCSRGMSYQFGCMYCSEFKIDYSRPKDGTPYNACAGISNIPDAIRDSYGNPQGSEYDLAEDGSFVGYSVIVLNLCDRYANIKGPEKALKKKGFSVIEYTSRNLPSVDILTSLLYGSERTQLWIISDDKIRLNQMYYKLIKQYFNNHHGVYLWGDNDPFYADINVITSELFNGATLIGNYEGRKVLRIQDTPSSPGIIADHLISTGLVTFFEGATISHIKFGSHLLQASDRLEPLMYSSDGKLLAVFHDYNGKRALIDGGFTRLYCDWDKAGTDRYVVNAAAWLANTEYFGYDPQ